MNQEHAGSTGERTVTYLYWLKRKKDTDRWYEYWEKKMQNRGRQGIEKLKKDFQNRFMLVTTQCQHSCWWSNSSLHLCLHSSLHLCLWRHSCPNSCFYSHIHTLMLVTAITPQSTIMLSPCVFEMNWTFLPDEIRSFQQHSSCSHQTRFVPSSNTLFVHHWTSFFCWFRVMAVFSPSTLYACIAWAQLCASLLTKTLDSPFSVQKDASFCSSKGWSCKLELKPQKMNSPRKKLYLQKQTK